MDNQKGEFNEISEEQFTEQMQEEKPLAFRTGEILEIRGSLFRIELIKKRKLILKLLPKNDKFKGQTQKGIDN